MSDRIDCTKASTDSATTPSCGEIYAAYMSAFKPDSKPVASIPADAPEATAAATQKIMVQVVEVPQVAPAEPVHLKIHRNPASWTVQKLGHFGKEYAIGVKESVEPRNLGRMTIPVGIGVATQLVVANQIKQGLKGGFNEVGTNLQQLGANQAALAQELAALEAQITALEAAKGVTTVAQVAGHVGGAAREATVVAAPRVVSGVSVQEVATSLPGQPATPASMLPGSGENVGVGAANYGSRIIVGGTNADGTVALPGSTRTLANPGGGVDLNANADLPNVGVDANGFAVAMTPKQVAKASEYRNNSQYVEQQLDSLKTSYKRLFDNVTDATSGSSYSPALLNDLSMRYTYAFAHDRLGDHKGARSFLMDCKQDIDNLKRIATSENNLTAIDQIDKLKHTIDQMDDWEKRFGKAPAVVFKPTSDAT